MIEVPGVGERGSRTMSRHTLAEVIEPRVEELYSLALAGNAPLPAGPIGFPAGL